MAEAVVKFAMIHKEMETTFLAEEVDITLSNTVKSLIVNRCEHI